MICFVWVVGELRQHSQTSDTCEFNNVIFHIVSGITNPDNQFDALQWNTTTFVGARQPLNSYRVWPWKFPPGIIFFFVRIVTLQSITVMVCEFAIRDVPPLSHSKMTLRARSDEKMPDNSNCHAHSSRTRAKKKWQMADLMAHSRLETLDTISRSKWWSNPSKPSLTIVIIAANASSGSDLHSSEVWREKVRNFRKLNRQWPPMPYISIRRTESKPCQNS